MKDEVTIKNVEIVSAYRLRKELQALGMESGGSRSELIIRLKQAGIYKVNTDITPIAEIKISERYENRSNIYIGNGAGKDNKYDNQFILGNGGIELMRGDIKKKRLKINNILKIEEEEFECDEEGEEGDIRREGSKLYMYRKSGCEEGWYPILFGIMKII